MTETRQELVIRAINTEIILVANNKHHLYWDKDILFFRMKESEFIYSPGDVLNYLKLEEYIEPPKKVKKTYYRHYYLEKMYDCHIFATNWTIRSWERCLIDGDLIETETREFEVEG